MIPWTVGLFSESAYGEYMAERNWLGLDTLGPSHFLDMLGLAWLEAALLTAILLSLVAVGTTLFVAYRWRTLQAATQGDEPSHRHRSSPRSSDRQHTSDAERVRQILADADGELPQQELVDRTDWSAAKVSRVTSELTERGDIEKISVGRQNVLRLVGDR